MRTTTSKIYCALFTGFLLLGNAYAQSSYLTFRIVRSANAGTQKLSELEVDRNGRSLTTGSYGTYARGLNFQAGLGKMLNPTLGFEISGEFALGGWIKTNIDSYDPDYSVKGYTKEKINAVLLRPMVVIRNSGDLLSFYTKLGFVMVPYMRKYGNFSYAVTNNAPATFNDYTARYVETAKLKTGFASAFGVAFRVSESISVSGEISGQIISLPVRKGYYTKATENGQDVLDQFTVNDREWRYTKSISDMAPDVNKPQERLYNPANYNAVGISFGIVYHL